MRLISNIVIHCTATVQTVTVAAIQRYWREEKKWKAPGYHLVINPDGSYVRLSLDQNPTNGVAGHNANSVHISYIGGVDAKGRPVDNRTPEQRRTMETLVRTMKARYPQARVLGHRDFPGVNKACPSFDVASWLKEIKL